MLDLATAYIEVGDLDGARQLLGELIAGGSTQAAAMLARLNDPAPRKPTPPPAPAKPLPPRAEPPRNPDGPTVFIAEFHSGGLILDGERPADGPMVMYGIVDGASEQWLDSEEFATYAEAQARVAERLAHLPRWQPPPASEEEHATLERIVQDIERHGWKHLTRRIWVHLNYYLRQRTHRPETVARIHAALEGNPYDLA